MPEDKYNPYYAAEYFFKLLGSPAEFADQTKEWTRLMREAMGSAQIADLSEMKRFLRWMAVEQKYSREYLSKAKDPMASLCKNAAREARMWRADNPLIDPDPLWESIKVVNDGKTEEKKRPRRKPRTNDERAEFFPHLFKSFGKTNPNMIPWLAQDACEQCHGTGRYKVKTHPDNKRFAWQEHFISPCECVLMEELLVRKDESKPVNES